MTGGNKWVKQMLVSIVDRTSAMVWLLGFSDDHAKPRVTTTGLMLKVCLQTINLQQKVLTVYVNMEKRK